MKQSNLTLAKLVSDMQIKVLTLKNQYQGEKAEKIINNLDKSLTQILQNKDQISLDELKNKLDERFKLGLQQLKALKVEAKVVEAVDCMKRGFKIIYRDLSNKLKK